MDCGEGSTVGFIIGGGIVVGIVAYCIVVVVRMNGIIEVDVLGVIIGVSIIMVIIVGVGIVIIGALSNNVYVTFKLCLPSVTTNFLFENFEHPTNYKRQSDNAAYES